MTIQKLTQFGILKAIGAKSKELAKAVFLQIVILSAVSVGLGIGATLLIGNLLPEGMPFHLDAELIGLLAALFIVVAVLGSLLSLVKVMKVDPLEAIGGGAE
ncbi:ABC transporter permease [Bacillus sp. JCM 19041]|uniref:FtsX-like permease family protein n=1 Tax=Bacillus sp. JCM 19041 TaxID=1460637 RepID=UPI0006CFDFD9